MNADGRPIAPLIDTTKPHPARRYDAWLGGKDNFKADRLSAKELSEAFPSMRTAVAENRAWLQRCVRFLAGSCGVRQFIDVGCGLPAQENVHEIAQRVDPGSRVVYVDNDPLVGVHARAILAQPSGDTTGFVEANLSDTHKILSEAGASLNFKQPVGLLLAAVLHFIPDEDDPYGAVGRLVGALPPGSYVGLTHVSFDALSDEVAGRLLALAESGNHGIFRARTRPDVLCFLNGLQLLAPGLVSPIDWHPELYPEPNPDAGQPDVASWAAVARIPERQYDTSGGG
jgi:hypothetical protein